MSRDAVYVRTHTGYTKEYGDKTMNIYSKDENLIIEEVKDFDICDILECGQCFHFTKLGEKEYELMSHGRYLHIKQDGDTAVLYDTSVEDYEAVWKSYFDMERDYGFIKNTITQADERLLEPVTAKPGIRILNQDFFETLISFIISQNKQIPHIKQIVHTISRRYGEEIITGDGRSVYTFPTAGVLNAVSEDELRECKVGFRAPYIKDAVRRVISGELCEEELKALPVQEAREKLMSIKGVGEKVSNCVLLFGLGRRDSFPVDVWMKRIMEYMYFHEDTKKEVIEQYAHEKFGEYAGYAQQYLFHFGRENGLGK